jgi:hypothetical protein
MGSMAQSAKRCQAKTESPEAGRDPLRRLIRQLTERRDKRQAMEGGVAT